MLFLGVRLAVHCDDTPDASGVAKQAPCGAVAGIEAQRFEPVKKAVGTVVTDPRENKKLVALSLRQNDRSLLQFLDMAHYQLPAHLKKGLN